MRQLKRLLKNRLLQAGLALLVITCMSGITDNESNRIVDDILLIPYASEPPVIDGALDTIWQNVTNSRMLMLTEGSEAPEHWLDSFAAFRMMWNDDCLYIFVSVYDEEIYTPDGIDPGNQDNIEIFIDGDNSKNDSLRGYDENDVRWRYVYGQFPGCPFDKSGPGDFVFKQTEYGWNFEAAIPAVELSFDLEPGHFLGIEIQFTDCDSIDFRRLKWWSSSTRADNDPSTFGEAMLIWRSVSKILDVQQISYPPVIDGDFGNDEWFDIPRISFNHYIEDTDLNEISGVEDFWFTFRPAWDENNFYLLVEVIDDQKFVPYDLPSWQKDRVAVFFQPVGCRPHPYIDCFEGENWIYERDSKPQGEIGSGLATGNYKFIDTETGWNLELAIPVNAFWFELKAEVAFEFEISIVDADSTNFTSGQWWSPKPAWLSQETWGTVELVSFVDDLTNDVSIKSGVIRQPFTLHQSYPNPFNAEMIIKYEILENVPVTLTIYDLTAKEVIILINRLQMPGTYEIKWNGKNERGYEVASGIYIYKLRAGRFIENKKALLIK